MLQYSGKSYSDRPPIVSTAFLMLSVSTPNLCTLGKKIGNDYRLRIWFTGSKKSVDLLITTVIHGSLGCLAALIVILLLQSCFFISIIFIFGVPLIKN